MMKRRVLCVLMAFAICVGLLPVQVFAAQNDTVTVTLSPEEIVFSPAETSAQAMNLLTLDETGKVKLTATNEVEWIDRLDLTGAIDPSALEEQDNNYALRFYDYLVSGADKDAPLRKVDSTEYTAVVFTGTATFTYTGDEGKDGPAAYAAVSDAVLDNWNAALAYLSAVFYAFDRDHPEVFWLSGEIVFRQSFSYSYSSDGTVTYTQPVSFVLRDVESGFDIRADKYLAEDLTVDVDWINDTATDAENETEKLIDIFEDNMTTPYSRYEMVREIHDYLTQNNCYNSSEDLSSIDHICREYVSALTGSDGVKGPVCEGYARAFKVLCDAAGIPCVLVDGQASSDGVNGEAHMWNYVEMDDGKWYAVDVTWDDPTVSGVDYAESGYENRNYFLVGDKTEINGLTFAASHLVSNCPSTSAPAFTNGPELSENDYEAEEEGGNKEEESNVVASGKCGDDLTWTLTKAADADGDDCHVLSISGTGAMYDYGSLASGTNLAPWSDYRASINKVLIGEDVTYLGNFALVGCTALTEMDIPDNVTALGTNLFRDCTALVKVGFGSGVTAFSNYLFYGCTSLGNMEIPSHVTTIGKNAFYGCKGLTEMTVPNTVTSMGERAFCGCTSLKKVTIGKNMTSFSNELFYGCSSLTEVVFPEGMVSLGQHTFYKCTSLTTIKIPEVKEIGKFTFAYCSALTEVIIPDSVTAIGTYAFTGCTALKTIRLPEGIIVLSGGIFDDCTALAEITIPEKVTSIDAYAFKGCASLSDVTFEGDAPKINYNSFYKVTATCYYPADNETWTADVRKDYGGTLTWEVLSEPGPTPVTVTITPEKLSLNLESEVHVNVDATITVSDWDRVVEIGLMTWYTRTDNANDATIENVDVVTPGCTLLDNGYYRVRSQGIPAKNMADDVWYKVYVMLDDGSYVYSARMKYSPKMYSNTILGDDSYSDEMKALCVALMNYGAEAQTFFADKGEYAIPTVNGVETLMNADISAEDQARVKAFDAAMLDERLTADSSKHGEFTTSSLYKTYSMFLSLEGAITLNYNIFHNAPAGNVTDCGMLIWTEEDYAEATILTWENASAQIDGVISDGCFTTAYTGNAAKNMGDTVYACAYMEVDGEYHYIVFRSSVDYFVENIIKSNSQTELMKSLAQHLAVYGEYAAAYFASK